MSAAQLSPAQVLTRIAVEFCVPMISGGVKGQAPVPGRHLAADARAKLGITGDGATILYPVGEDGVVLDMQGAASTLWFENADCVEALATFEPALQRAFPALQQLKDLPNEKDPDSRTRGYSVELGDGKLATIEVGYPLPHAQGKSRIFVVRVTALKRVAAAAGAPAPLQAPASENKSEDKKKKKGWF